MNLTNTVPRSPKDKMLGIVSLKRVIDKARAFNEGTLGEYHYDCPHDKPLLAFLGIDAATFAHKVGELGSDDAIAGWVEASHLRTKTPAEIQAFNHDRMHWHPDPGSEVEVYFKQLHDRVAPGRDDVVTWFDALDLDENRPVAQPTRL